MQTIPSGNASIHFYAMVFS